MHVSPVWRFLLAPALLVVLAACSESSATIDLSRTEKQTTPVLAAPSDDLIRMAVAPVLSPVPTLGLYQELADYVSDKLGRPVELIQGKTYQEINGLVKSGEAPVAIVCTGAYLDGREDFGMEALVVPYVDGNPYYYSLLIVRKDLDVTSFQDLRARAFAFSDPLSNTGRLVPLYQLALMGETPDTFFSRTLFTYAHDNSIRSVAEAIVDAAAVDSLVYDYMLITEPDVIQKVRVVERWGPFGINPIVVNPLLDRDLKDSLRDLFLSMDKDPRGRSLLRRLMIDRFLLPDDHLYDSVLEMRAYLKEHGLGP